MYGSASLDHIVSIYTEQDAASRRLNHECHAECYDLLNIAIVIGEVITIKS
jgi:hypothetical protein